MGVEAVAFGRIERTVDAVAIELTGQNGGEVAMPNLVGPFAELDALGFNRVGGRMEEAEFDLLRVFRKEGEVNARTLPGGPERVRAAGLGLHRGLHTFSM